MAKDVSELTDDGLRRYMDDVVLYLAHTLQGERIKELLQLRDNGSRDQLYVLLRQLAEEAQAMEEARDLEWSFKRTWGLVSVPESNVAKKIRKLTESYGNDYAKQA